MTKNTNKRLYFTDPIKALYMMREFGVRAELLDEQLNEFKGISEIELLNLIINLNKNHGTPLYQIGTDFYVARKSESIFEFKNDDFVTNSFKTNESRYCHGFIRTQPDFMDDSGRRTVKVPQRHNGKYYFVESESSLTIIMRDNKHFFTPEVSND